MTEKQKELLELIKARNTLRAISEEMNLSPKQAYQRIITLQNKGYNIYRNDYINGDIEFYLNSNIENFPNEKIIFTPHDCKKVRSIFLSDTHLGNIKQRLDVLHGTYNYGIKNGIHVIFHCGDFTEGLYRTSYDKSIEKDYETQLNNALKNYPYDKNINNYIILGNHDKYYLDEEKLDISKAIQKKRYDICPIGYGNAKVYLKNDEIILIHQAEKTELLGNSKIIFKGHSHKSKQKISINSEYSYTYVPMCSDIITRSRSSNNNDAFELPSIIDVTFEFNDCGMIEKMYQYLYVYTDRLIKVNEIEKTFNPPNNKSGIKYEKTPKVLEKKIEPPVINNNTNNKRMSQIEKFNARYKK